MPRMQESSARIESVDRSDRLILKILGSIAFAFLMILSAHIRIPLPFTPIPMTLQTFVAPLAGGFLGALWGGGSMLLYLALGLAGLDVFAASAGGFAIFLAPSAGYLTGFFFAAMIVGAARNQNNLILLGALILSQILIFACGTLGLMANAGMSLPEAFAKGVAPFLMGDVIKITASFLVLLSYRTIIVR